MSPETREALARFDPVLRELERQLEEGRELRRRLLSLDRRLAASDRRLAESERALAEIETARAELADG